MTETELAAVLERRMTFLLRRRPYSRAELIGYCSRYTLRKKIEISPDSIDTIVDLFMQKNGLSDQLFAQWWIQQRSQFRQRSRRVLSFELKQKGVPPETIEESLQKGYTNDVEAAIDYIAQRPGLLRNPEKALARLLRRGFSYAHSKVAIEQNTNKE
jgi:SOS response regulatory protein OraA/RecX